MLLYEKIALELKARISNKVYPVTARIPGEGRLAKEFNVARPTLHKAILLLEKQGLLECRPSVGNFVLKLPKTKRLYAYIAPSLSDPFHAEFIREFNTCVVAEGGSLLIDDNSHTSARKIIARLQEEDVDGIIYCSPQNSDSLLVSESGIPAVWFSSVPVSEDIDYLITNNEQGLAAVMAHLVESGINNIGYAEGYSGKGRSIRHEFFIKQLAASKLSSNDKWLLASDLDGEKGGRQLFEMFINLKKRPEALICYNDWNAIGFIEAALDYGLAIPDELRVIGFDNLLLSRFFKVPLTTVDCNLQALAQQAFKMVSNRIANPGIKRQVHIEDCSLIIRKS